MNMKLVAVLFLIGTTQSAPTNMVPFPGLPQFSQSPFLRPLLPNIQPPGLMYRQPPTPMIILLPNTAPTMLAEERYTKLNEQTKSAQPNKDYIDEANDAIVLENEHKPEEMNTRNAVVYVPNEGRLVIGTIISYIPFLPFEINVPDTISSIYSWISGIWSRPPADTSGSNATRLYRGSTPVLVMPLPESVPRY